MEILNNSENPERQGDSMKQEDSTRQGNSMKRQNSMKCQNSMEQLNSMGYQNSMEQPNSMGYQNSMEQLNSIEHPNPIEQVIPMKQGNTEKEMLLEQKIKKDCGNVTGIVVLRNGITQYERYFNGCTQFSKVHVYSVTKSILSALVGIAIGRGQIKSIHQKVLDFFPEYSVKKGERTIQNITIEHLLTMTAPYKYGLFPPYVKYFTSQDRVKFTLDLLGGKGDIGNFRYAPLIGPDLLSGILMKATGQSVLSFAKENLFSPLGIEIKGHLAFQNEKEQMDFNKSTSADGWAVDPAGVNAGGWGLTLSPADMAKIGQLYLNGGIWNRRQIVPAEWIDQSTKEHSRWEKEKLSFGYLWWIIDEKEHAYAAMGDGGNVIYVNTMKKLVVAITSLFQPDVSDRITFIREFVEPLFSDCCNGFC